VPTEEEWIPVESSNLKAVYYFAELTTLLVKFKDEAIYSYEAVSQEEFDGLLAAPSKGKYFHEVIKKHTCLQLSYGTRRPPFCPSEPEA
jgi:hypothetical protein